MPVSRCPSLPPEGGNPSGCKAVVTQLLSKAKPSRKPFGLLGSCYATAKEGEAFPETGRSREGGAPSDPAGHLPLRRRRSQSRAGVPDNVLNCSGMDLRFQRGVSRKPSEPVSYDTYNQLTSLLALLANGLAAVILVIFVGGRFGVGSLAGARDWLGDAFRDVGVWIAAAVATSSTVGSLIYSEYFDLIPCRLCWYQRIAMYPLVVILILAAVRRDNPGARRYGIPLAIIGTAIAGYHYLIQQFPSLESGSCSLEAPCSSPYVWQYGFISIPYMALAGFTLILLLLFTIEKTPSNT